MRYVSWIRIALSSSSLRYSYWYSGIITHRLLLDTILLIQLPRLVLKTVSVRNLRKMFASRACLGHTLALNSFICSLRFMWAFCPAITLRRFANTTRLKPQLERVFNRNFLRHILYHPAAFQMILLPWRRFVYRLPGRMQMCTNGNK